MRMDMTWSWLIPAGILKPNSQQRFGAEAGDHEGLNGVFFYNYASRSYNKARKHYNKFRGMDMRELDESAKAILARYT